MGTALAALVLALPFRPHAGPRARAGTGRRLALLGTMVVVQQVAISLHNDWCDRDLDRVAKPHRAIPRGLVPAPAVRGAAWGLGALSVALAAPAGRRLVLLDLCGTAAGFLYNARLKRSPLSPLPFALAFPLLPLFGAATLDAWPRRWWSLFVVGAPAVLAIHLSDAIPDLEGDARAGVGGLAHRLGSLWAGGLCRGALAGAALTAAALSLAGGGAARGSRRGFAPLAGAVAGAGMAGLATLRPALQRVAVPLGAAAVALGWVAAVAADQT